MTRWLSLLVVLLSAAIAHAEVPLTLVADRSIAPAPTGVSRVLVRVFEAKASATESWPLVELFGPLPDAKGADLLASHPDWLAVGADGKTRLPGTPCYAVAAARQARVAQVAALAARGAQGVCLSALPRADWPAQANIARDFAAHPELLRLFRARYDRAAQTAVDRALLAGLQAEGCGALLEAIRKQCPKLKLALACVQRDLVPHTATGAALDVPGYIKSGWVDAVFVAAPAPGDLLGLKLQTDAPLPTAAWCAADSADGLRPGLMAALRVPGLDGVVLDAPGAPRAIAELARSTEAAFRAQQDLQAALEQAIQSGKLQKVAGCELKGKADQANVHGVAQSFQVTQATSASAIGLLLSLRGPAPWSVSPLTVTLRNDAGGKPGDEVLATATIPPDGLSPEPGYRWAYARLDRVTALQPGRKYWLHGAEPPAGGGSYMWRIAKDGGYDDGQAWSSRYDYGAHDWVFGIYAEGK